MSRSHLQNWNGYSSKYKYVGLANYVKMFHDKMFYTALKNTFIYGVGSTTIQTIVGVAYALLLQKKFHGQTLTRVIVYLPGHDRFPDHGLYFLLSGTV